MQSNSKVIIWKWVMSDFTRNTNKIQMDGFCPFWLAFVYLSLVAFLFLLFHTHCLFSWPFPDFAALLLFGFFLCILLARGFSCFLPFASQKKMAWKHWGKETPFRAHRTASPPAQFEGRQAAPGMFCRCSPTKIKPLRELRQPAPKPGSPHDIGKCWTMLNYINFN